MNEGVQSITMATTGGNAMACCISANCVGVQQKDHTTLCHYCTWPEVIDTENNLMICLIVYAQFWSSFSLSSQHPLSIPSMRETNECMYVRASPSIIACVALLLAHDLLLVEIREVVLVWNLCNS